MPDVSSQYIENMLIKELALAYPDIVSAYSSNDEGMGESVVESLETELCRVCDKIELIHPGELVGSSTAL